jgi:hypothetical protein
LCKIQYSNELVEGVSDGETAGGTLLCRDDDVLDNVEDGSAGSLTDSSSTDINFFLLHV